MLVYKNAGRTTGQLLQITSTVSNFDILQTFPHFYTFYLLQLVLIWSRLHSCWKVWGLFWPNIDMWCLCLSWISFVFGGWNGKNDADKVDQGLQSQNTDNRVHSSKNLCLRQLQRNADSSLKWNIFIPMMTWIPIQTYLAQIFAKLALAASADMFGNILWKARPCQVLSNRSFCSCYSWMLEHWMVLFKETLYLFLRDLKIHGFNWTQSNAAPDTWIDGYVVCTKENMHFWLIHWGLIIVTKDILSDHSK